MATPASNWPTLLHVTHAKSGSQWLRAILDNCAPHQVVHPVHGMGQFLENPVRSGMIYPALFVTKDEFDGVVLPPNARRFVVIRDLRDTLVSWYFSLKVSHTVDHSTLTEMRNTLNALTFEKGLIWLIEDPYFSKIATIQSSWCQSGELLVRYEDLLERDEEILERILLRECGIPVERARLREIIHANRFDQLTGRTRGTEDVSSHQRKGIAGDWCNHFTHRVKDSFKERFGTVLIETGYESTDSW